ncbi:enoyl-CoA-hydratase DpgB [Dactylosporangium siamense]|nr:enoyl-CoA-hydratase DpgB [Dactylosporangium siamense]
MSDEQAAVSRIELSVDGERPLSAETVDAVAGMCRRAEDADGAAVVVLRVSGTPRGEWARDLNLRLVNRWEQALRRLERVPATTIALAAGACGGPALDVLLATDHRIAARSVRLVLPMQGGLVWPGMALYRLARQAPSATAVRQAALYGTAIGLDDALALHLVHEVTGDVEAALGVAVGRAAAVSGTELAVRRQLALDAPTVAFEEALGTHLAAVDRALRIAAGTPS